MSTPAEFFLGSNRSVVQLETLEITHPSFSKAYRVVRNARKGITAKIESGSSVSFDYLPMKVTNSGARDDLDNGIQVSIGDLGQTIPKELDRVFNDNAFAVLPICTYRSYRSDDLTHILIGPYKFEIKAIAQDQQGATFEAKAPGLNQSKTGELYRIDRFAMLRGFL